MMQLVCLELKGTILEFFQTPMIRWLKWVAPVFVCGCSFAFQSFMLHIATMHYVWDHYTHEKLDEPLRDKGFELFGHKHISLQTLDAVSCGAMVVFVFGSWWLRDLRLWVKVFISCSLLFFVKGFVDCVTVLPDSIGWDSCARRLTTHGVEAFRELGDLAQNKQGSGRFWLRLASYEFYGIKDDDGKTIWPLRYCADMVPSGHTFVMMLFMLALADLVLRLSLLAHSDITRRTCSVIVGIVCLGVVFADMYLILVNHFHYTIDIFLSALLVLLIYTNAAVTVTTNWFVEAWEERDSNERSADDYDLIWIPPVFVPFCCASGYYYIGSLTRDEVIERQRKNRSRLLEKLGCLAHYGSFERDGESSSKVDGEDKIRTEGV